MLLKGYDSATAKTKANVDGEWGEGKCWCLELQGWLGGLGHTREPKQTTA